MMKVTMKKKTACITGTREEMVAFSTRLADGLNMDSRPHPRRPVIISVQGTYRTGKSLVSETVAERLTGVKFDFDRAQLNRMKGSRSPYEMQFCNLAHDLCQLEALESVMDQREKPVLPSYITRRG